ncbi:MAG: 4-hydroxy-tetrahydrodipicolinate synthase [Steroidobacteraceae bacterium]|jgi:4-hydroxy-tetrahydrodipicolinate synthase|nr:4-hydroxy-tetrahydrodipicolinate synthase [Gammaproteobacteria bacterium]
MFSGSYVAIVTPMRADGSIDLDAWSRLIDWHLASGTNGVIVGGTTGESPTVTEAELAQLIARARQQIAGRMVLMAGAGQNGTASTVERVRAMCALGVDALLVVTPSYNKPTQEGLFRHFSAVAEASSVPVMLYNVPGRTAVDMLPATVARLAELPRIAAIKEAVGDLARIRELLAVASRIAIFSGDDATAREAVLAGARGVVSVTANVAPQGMSRMIAAALAGDAAGAASIDATLADLHQDLFIESNPIPVKWALARMGYIDDGIRLPLTPLSASCHARVLAALTRAGISFRSST